MINRKGYIGILLFVLILCLGVGYAVVNSVSLTITGTAGAGSENLDVYFTGTTETSNSSKGVATASGTSANVSISNMTLNETVTLEYEIKNNESDVDAELVVTIPTSNDYFEISISEGSISDSSGTGHATPVNNGFNVEYEVVPLMEGVPGGNVEPTYTQTFSIGAGQTFALMVTVKMIKTPITTSDSTFDFNIDIAANPVSGNV